MRNWASTVALLAVLVGVHEALLGRVASTGWREAAYLQVLVLAQSIVLALSAALLASVAGRAAPAVAGLGLTLAPLLYLDSLLRSRIGLGLAPVSLLLLDAHLDEDRRLLDAAGIGVGVVAQVLGTLTAVAVAGAWVDARTAGLAPPWRALAPRRSRLAAIWVATVLALGGLEMGAAHVVRAGSWLAFGRTVPQLLGALGPGIHAKAAFRAALRRRPDEAAMAAALARLNVPATPPPGDVLFFVVESLRADAIDATTTPALDALARESLEARVAVSGGNVTHYGWYSLFGSWPALYWQLDPAPEDRGGATGLRVARRRGWRVEILWSGDPAYMRMDDMLLGGAHGLADEVLAVRHGAGSSAQDEAVLAELAARVARPHAPTVYVVSLEATHLPYDWTADFVPPFEPFAAPTHYMHAQVDAAERRAVYDRYRDAVAFVDSRLGRFLDAQRATGALEDETVVVTGDHGEEFWEHGVSSHSAEACGVQTHVALLVKPSRALRSEGDWTSPKPLASAIDVWPTLLDAAGVRGDLRPLLAGTSLLRGTAPAALTATQRYRDRPARFVLDRGEQKVELELRDPDHPFQSQEVDVLALLDGDDRPTDDGLTATEILGQVRERFGDDLQRFFEVQW